MTMERNNEHAANVPIILKQENQLEDLSKQVESLSLKNEKISFKQELRNIFNDYKRGTDQEKILIRGAVEKLYNQQTELDEDLTKDETFNNDERSAFFDIAKQLNLPIIVGTDSYGISLFSLYKGQSIIQSITEIELNGFRTPDDQKLTTFFISDHFIFLNRIILRNQKLTEIELPNLPNLSFLYLYKNKLKQLTLGDMPRLQLLNLENNQLTQFTLDNMPSLRVLYLSHNKLNQLILGDMIYLFDLAIDNIPSITAHYDNRPHTFENPSNATVLNYIATGNAYLMYADGLDVHSNNRDQKMKELAQVFKEKIELAPRDIDKTLEDFYQYLEDLEKKNESSEQLVQKAKFILGLPVKKDSDFTQGGFGPLRLDDSLITAYGLNMTRKEFIARLWFFASNYTDPRSHNTKEGENAQYAVVTSLAEAINEYKERVCDDGKLQRLFTGVLQGRIEEINVDGLTSEQLQLSKVTPYDNFIIFKAGLDHEFTKESDNILYNPTKLREQVKKFLEDNASVDVEEFNKYIEDFIASDYYER